MVTKILFLTMLMTTQTWAQGLQLPKEIICHNSEYPKGHGSKLTVVNRSPRQVIDLYLQISHSEILHNASYRFFGKMPEGASQLNFEWYAGMNSSDYDGEEFAYSVNLNWFGYFRTKKIILGVRTHQTGSEGHNQDVTTYYQYQCN